MIIDYVILASHSSYELEKTVKRYITAGWEPQGGIHVDHATSDVEFFQSMIKRAKV